jgi:hypothetical protein
MIIGFLGKLGSGKDYLVNNMVIPYLQRHKEHKNTVVVSYADALKVELMVHMDMDFEKLYIQKDKQSRQMLQLYGTDIMRKKHGEDVWIRYVDAWIKVHQYHNKKVENNKDTIFIIPDIRFENEAEFIRTSGGKVIKIEANDRVQEKVVQENLGLEQQQHVSETNIDNIKADYVVNNSKLQQPFVFQKVTSILNDITF